MFQKWTKLEERKKKKYELVSKEFCIIPMTLQRRDKVKIRGRYAVKHDSPLDFYYMMNRGYERDQTPCTFL